MVLPHLLWICVFIFAAVHGVVETKSKGTKARLFFCQHRNAEGELHCKKGIQYSSRKTGIPDMCKEHGGGNRCEHTNDEGVSDCAKCAQHSKNGTGVLGMCITHGGGDRCQHKNEDGKLDCKTGALVSRSGTGIFGMCFKHGGGDRCQHTDDEGKRDCTKSAQNSKYAKIQRWMCFGHGGGNTCQHKDRDGQKDCTSMAVVGKRRTGVEDMCKLHGGGDRCEHKDSLGKLHCKNSAVTSNEGVQAMCKSHGGGPKCQHKDEHGESDCIANARTSTDGLGISGMCGNHGGDNRCQHENMEGEFDCTSRARTSDRKNGVYGMCKLHGGGNRCDYNGCFKTARYAPVGETATRCSDHRDDDMVIVYHKVCQCEACLVNVDEVTYAKYTLESGERVCWRAFRKQFPVIGQKIKNSLRRELLLLSELFLELPERLGVTHEYFMGKVTHVNGNKQIDVECDKARPDQLMCFKEFVVLTECDEKEHMDRTFESELNHVAIIHKGLKMPPIVVLRINPDGKEPMFVEKYNGARLDEPALHKGKLRKCEPVWYPSEFFEDKLDAIIDRVLPIFESAMRDELPACLESPEPLQLTEHMHDLPDCKVHQELFFFERRGAELKEAVANAKLSSSMKEFLYRKSDMTAACIQDTRQEGARAASASGSDDLDDFDDNFDQWDFADDRKCPPVAVDPDDDRKCSPEAKRSKLL